MGCRSGEYAIFCVGEGGGAGVVGVVAGIVVVVTALGAMGLEARSAAEGGPNGTPFEQLSAPTIAHTVTTPRLKVDVFT